MATVEFIYNGASIMIQCQVNDKMEDVVQKFLIKIEKDKGSVFFLYSGKTLDEDLTFIEVANKLDKEKNLMKVQAWDLLFDDNIASLIKSPYVICPECYEKALIEFDDDYQITIYKCKNGHETENIQLKDFEKTQLIDQSKIKCEACKIINKNSTPNNSFFRCLKCKLNICPKCKKDHEEQQHITVNYEDKDFYCEIHYEKYYCFCHTCEKDICSLCENQHNDHEIFLYETFDSDIETSKKELVNLKESIRNLRKDIKEIISKLNLVIDNLNNYYNIYNYIISNYDSKKKYHMQIDNIIELQNYNLDFMKNISEITFDKNLKTKFSELIKLYEKMSKKDENKNKENINNIDELKEKEEEENYENNIIRFNPSENKYEGFEPNKLKVILSFQTKYEIDFLMVLHDRRVLTHQIYKDEIGNEFSKIFIYDLSSTIICDINYDSENKIKYIYQMKDDNILIITKVIILEDVKVFKIKKKSIEEIYSSKYRGGQNLFELLNDKFLTKVGIEEDIYIYSYENGKLNQEKILKLYKKKEQRNIKNVVSLNEKEIVIYYSKVGKIYGWNAFIKFYDIIKDIKIQTLKLGDYDNGSKMILFDKNNLIVEYNYKLVLIDPIQKFIKVAINHGRERRIHSMIPLNYKQLVTVDFDYYYLYEIENDKIKYIYKMLGRAPSNLKKYPDNKFITNKFKDIYIYDY